MGKLKTHLKNGFEYRCEREYGGGYWYHTWEFRPETYLIWIHYLSGKEKTLKKDMEELLSDPQKARLYYDEILERNSNIRDAEKEYELASAEYERSQTDPYFDDFRGNNPKKIGRKTKAAHDRYQKAKKRLQTAKYLTKTIKKTNNRK